MKSSVGTKAGSGVEKTLVMRCARGARASQHPRARARGDSVSRDVPRGMMPRIYIIVINISYFVYYNTSNFYNLVGME
jgi:hypothetical protein